jgi:multiple antibiotic resistance protein
MAQNVVMRRLATMALLCLAASPAAALALVDEAPPSSQIFTFLFLTLGPFKLIAPFAKASRGLDGRDRLRLAALAVAFAAAALALAGLIGGSTLDKYAIPLPILAFSGGLILFLSALMTVLHQFSDAPPAPDRAPPAERPPLAQLAAMPLAFPAIVTPYGVAALVLFLALAPDTQGRLAIAGQAAGILALDFVVMLLTRPLLPALMVVLPVLGAVLGVVQVALGLQIMHLAARALMAS